MKVLFVHQAFPAQFCYLAPALAARGDQVVGLSNRTDEPHDWRGVSIVRYLSARQVTPGVHPWAANFEAQVIRAEAAFHAACALRDQGFEPDVIIAHPGWGESLFLNEVWPRARLGIYCEIHQSAYSPNFDPEFALEDPTEPLRRRVKNSATDLHFGIAKAGLSPTRWQADAFPESFLSKIDVIHEGVDTDLVAPNPAIEVGIPGGPTLTRDDEVVTFVSRNLEPLRGYHIFMRALPAILAARPRAHVFLVGGDQGSYGPAAPGGANWKQVFIDEVRPRISDEDWKRVHILAPLPYASFIALMQLSSVHVYLTYPYVLSWSLIEAMSAGCAIVASDTGPVREAITDGETGRLVDFFDVAGLADQVGALLADPAERARLGAAARARAVAGYDLETVCLPKQIAWVDRLASL